MKNWAMITLLVLSFSACTWVKLTPEGEKVRVLSADEAKNCKKLGLTRAMLKDKIAGVSRNEQKVKTELETLARNSAVDMGGDTVVPVSEIEEGKQVFDVYRCVQ